MRQLGGILVLCGLVGFVYFSSALEGAPPRDPQASLSQEIATPGGRLELLRYASAGAAAIGILLALFPKGR
jgi:hypothetical protein